MCGCVSICVAVLFVKFDTVCDMVLEDNLLHGNVQSVLRDPKVDIIWCLRWQLVVRHRVSLFTKYSYSAQCSTG